MKEYKSLCQQYASLCVTLVLCCEIEYVVWKTYTIKTMYWLLFFAQFTSNSRS